MVREIQFRTIRYQGAWLAVSEEHATLGLGVVNSQPHVKHREYLK